MSSPETPRARVSFHSPPPEPARGLEGLPDTEEIKVLVGRVFRKLVDVKSLVFQVQPKVPRSANKVPAAASRPPTGASAPRRAALDVGPPPPQGLPPLVALARPVAPERLPFAG